VAKYRRLYSIALGVFMLVAVSASNGVSRTYVIASSDTIQDSSSSKTDKNTVYKDENGKIINQQEFSQKMSKGSYSAKPILADGRIAEVQLVKLSPEEAKKRAERRDPQKSKIGVGTKSPGFKGETLDGKTISFDDLKDKVVVLNFWFIGCKPCVMEMPELNKLVAKYKGNSDIVFVSIAMDDKKNIDGFLRTHPFDYQIIPRGNKIMSSFDVNVYPTHIVVGKDGVIQHRTYGLGSNTIGDLESKIRNAMKKGRS